MAVVKNFWLRDNSQKLGGAVIYQVNGQTLMRQLAPAVSNPRTDAQMSTRVRLANLVAFYRVSAKWMRGAFESKAANQSDYNAFVSANAAANAVWLTKSQVDAGTCIVAPYVISRGSMGEIRQSVTATQIASNLYTGELTISAATTIADLSAALISNNNGLQNGDQLSIIQYIQNTGTGGAYSVVCRAYEVILNSSNILPLSNYLPVDILTTTGGDNSALAILTASFVGGASFIISRTQGGRILVSTSQVSLTANNAVYAAMTSTTQKENAVRSYGANTTTFLDSATASAANSDVASAISILSIRVGNMTIAPGEELPKFIRESDVVIINLSAAVEDAAEIGIDFKNIQSGDRWGLASDDTHGNNPTQTLTTSVNEESTFSEAGGWRLILTRGIENPQVITYADFQSASENGEGLG